MKIQILKKEYEVIDAKEKVTIADSFVVRQNKIGRGNGEAKLYIGNEGEELRNFFGEKGFLAKCFLLQKDLISYLEENEIEYNSPEQPYLNKEKLPKLWKERLSQTKNLPDLLEFSIQEQVQIKGPRVYIKSSDKFFNLIRELSLPNISYLSIVKIKNFYGSNNDGYYFRLFTDYFDDYQSVFSPNEKAIKGVNNEEKTNIIKARIGQGEYRKKLLELCPFCPLTMISDERILVASHIKPWAKSDNFEKTDPYNGFMLTPNFDLLFDRGFLSFTDDKKIILSPFLSKMTYSKLRISDNKTVPLLPTEGREKYLEYHRNNILKK